MSKTSTKATVERMLETAVISRTEYDQAKAVLARDKTKEIDALYTTLLRKAGTGSYQHKGKVAISTR